MALLPSHEPERTLKACMLLYACYLFEMYCLRHKDVLKHGECVFGRKECVWVGKDGEGSYLAWAPQ